MADGSRAPHPSARPDMTAIDDPSASPAAGLLLQAWLSPAFPVGAFAYSHGLEWAAEARLVRDRSSLELWLADLVDYGGARSDLILLANAWRASRIDDDVALCDVAELAAVLQPTAERRLEAVTQGNAFLIQIEAAWPCAAVERLRRVWTGDVTHAIAVAVAAAGHDVPLQATLDAFALAFVSNLTSAAIRLSVIGQTDGQRIVAALLPTTRRAAAAAERATLDDLGTATWASDVCSLQHETQYTRLFRS